MNSLIVERKVSAKYLQSICLPNGKPTSEKRSGFSYFHGGFYVCVRRPVMNPGKFDSARSMAQV
jgi:hypothetical protein